MNKNIYRKSTLKPDHTQGMSSVTNQAFSKMISNRDQKSVKRLTMSQARYSPSYQRYSTMIKPLSPVGKRLHRINKSLGSAYKFNNSPSPFQLTKNGDLSDIDTPNKSSRNAKHNFSMNNYQQMVNGFTTEREPYKFRTIEDYKKENHDKVFRELGVDLQSVESQVQLNLDEIPLEQSKSNSESEAEENISSGDDNQYRSTTFHKSITCFPQSPKSGINNVSKNNVYGDNIHTAQPQSLTPQTKVPPHTRYQSCGQNNDFETMFEEENVFDKTHKIHIVTDVGNSSPYEPKKQTNKVINSSIINRILSKPKKIELLSQNSSGVKKKRQRTSTSMTDLKVINTRKSKRYSNLQVVLSEIKIQK